MKVSNYLLVQPDDNNLSGNALRQFIDDSKAIILALRNTKLQAYNDLYDGIKIEKRASRTVIQAIFEADFIVFNVNPYDENVSPLLSYLIGLRHTTETPSILVSRNFAELPRLWQHGRIIEYSVNNQSDLQSQFEQEIKNIEATDGIVADNAVWSYKATNRKDNISSILRKEMERYEQRFREAETKQKEAEAKQDELRRQIEVLERKAIKDEQNAVKQRASKPKARITFKPLGG